MLSKIDVMDTDILCGRGRGLESFPGNTIFRRVIKEHADRYGRAKTSRAEKSRLVRLVADRLAEEDMRFVKKVNKKDWVALEDSDAKLKVSRALRDAGIERSKKQHFKQNYQQLKKDLEQEKSVSIISEDEGDNSGKEDRTSIDDVSQQLASLEDGDVWAPLPVDMDKPFQPRLSFKALDYIAVVTIIESADMEQPMIYNGIPIRDEPDVISPKMLHDDCFSGAETKEDLDFDVSLSEVFLRFLDDEGASADGDVREINPDEWL